MCVSLHNRTRRKHFRKNPIHCSFIFSPLSAHARISVLRIRQHALSSLWYFSLSDRRVPLSAGRTLVAQSCGPVVLKSGRNRRYRPVAQPVIVGRAVTNQVSGPRPSGHFPAPTWGPCRLSPSLPVHPAGRGVALEAPRRLLPPSPSFPLDAGPPPLSVEETRLSREVSPSCGS